MHGVYTALITPFNEENCLDEEGLRFLLSLQIRSEIQGIVLLGSTGESATLTDSERARIIEIAIEECKGKIPLYAGCGTNSTAKTIQYCQEAEKWGIDGLMIVTPYYNRPTQEGIYHHFKAISESTCLPICIYNVANRTGQNIETETLSRIAELRGIIAVKDCSGSILQASQVIEQIVRKKEGFSFLSGDDPMTLPTLAIGGSGIISVISNLVPQSVVQLVRTAYKGNYPAAQDIYYALQPLATAAFLETNPTPIKYMMHLSGMPSGRCRQPLWDLLPETKQKIQSALFHSKDLLQKEKTLPPLLSTSSDTLLSLIG